MITSMEWSNLTLLWAHLPVFLHMLTLAFDLRPWPLPLNTFWYMNYFLRLLVQSIWQTTDRRQTESDAYEPTVQIAQVGSKTWKIMFLTSWPWPLTYDLDHQTWPRFHQDQFCVRVSNGMALRVLTNWQTDRKMGPILLPPPLRRKVMRIWK